ncbi:MAG: ABC transporter permease [delta proteobacterium ML8_D]|jgi:NitT/TauT family transport system permease protein|nr:MAG: ABC transporter permease [delta proteobacterium ML8_D]
MNKLNWLKPRWSMLPVFIFLLIWEMAARLGLIPGHFFFPPFTAVLQEFYHLTANGVLPYNFLRSLTRVLIGFTTGSIAGLLIGILMGYRETINKTFHPIFSLLYPIPALGWLPIFMLWFGISEILPIMIIFICSFFPILYNTITGIKTVDKNLIKVAKTLGASERKTFTTILLPLALPNIFTGLRLEAGMAWRVIIAAEMVAIPTGIGALLMRAESLIRIDIVIVCLMVLSVMCLSFERFFIYMEHKLTGNWR